MLNILPQPLFFSLEIHLWYNLPIILSQISIKTLWYTANSMFVPIQKKQTKYVADKQDIKKNIISVTPKCRYNCQVKL